MIWSITSKDEMENYGTSPVFRFYQEALGRDKIQLAVVDENDGLDFVSKNDIVLLRTASRLLIDTIKNKRLRSTAEYYDRYELVCDKFKVGKFLHRTRILVPRSFQLEEVQEGKTYFVKPRYGSDSFGVSEKSICHSASEVREQVWKLHDNDTEATIEEYIEGKEFTATCINDGILKVYAIEIDCANSCGIQTYESKKDYEEVGLRIKDVQTKLKVESLARQTFTELDLRHHARIDMRMDKQGQLYVIDVNLLPGLGPTGDLARCMLLNGNMSYIDALNAVLNTATR